MEDLKEKKKKKNIFACRRVESWGCYEPLITKTRSILRFKVFSFSDAIFFEVRKDTLSSTRSFFFNIREFPWLQCKFNSH